MGTALISRGSHGFCFGFFRFDIFSTPLGFPRFPLLSAAFGLEPTLKMTSQTCCNIPRLGLNTSFPVMIYIGIKPRLNGTDSGPGRLRLKGTERISTPGYAQPDAVPWIIGWLQFDGGWL